MYSSVIFCKRGIRTYEHVYRRNDKETRNSITMAGLVMVIVSGVYPPWNGCAHMHHALVAFLPFN